MSFLDINSLSPDEARKHLSTLDGITPSIAKVIGDFMAENGVFKNRNEFKKALSNAKVQSRYIESILDFVDVKISLEEVPGSLQLETPTVNEIIDETDEVLRFSGTLYGQPEWLDQIGANKYALREIEEASDTFSEVIPTKPQKSILTDEIVVNLSEQRLNVHLGNRVLPGAVEFFVEVAGSLLSPGNHTLEIGFQSNQQAVIQRNFSFAPFQLLQQTDGDNSNPPELNDPPKLIYSEVPIFLEPKEATVKRLIELLKRTRDIFTPPKSKEACEKEAKKLVGRLKRAREDFPDDDVILIPPRPGLSSEWRLIPRELLEKWKKAITALEKFWEANQAFEEAKKTGNESEYLKAFLRARRLGIEASEGIENYGEAIKCFCYCRVCIKIIKLKNNKKLSSPPTDKDAKDIVKKANQLFNKCRIKMIIEQIEAIEISDDEFTRFIEVGVNQTLDSPAMIRELSKRKPNPLSNSCFNIFLLSKKNGHLGKHPTISGTVSGFSTGKDGVLKSPATGTDPIPTHAVVNKYFGTEATARTLAHEMGHILCLKGYFALHYDKLDRTIFRETVTLNEEQRKGLTPMERHRKVNKLERQRAFDKASKFLEEMEKLISEERLKNKELSEEEAKSKVRKALSPDDQKRFDIVYNLMVLGSSLSPKDCVEMCKCIKKTYPSMCEG